MIPSLSASIDYAEVLRRQQAVPLRFAAMGALTFVVNVGLLALFTAMGMGPVLAYAVAMALAVQFNFATSQIWVWRDRRMDNQSVRALADRWARFHACIAVASAVNFVAFALAQLVMPVMLAVIAGVGASTLLKFISLDRLAFRHSRTELSEAGK